jgi:hypothetical protein
VLDQGHVELHVQLGGGELGLNIEGEQFALFLVTSSDAPPYGEAWE